MSDTSDLSTYTISGCNTDYINDEDRNVSNIWRGVFKNVKLKDGAAAKVTENVITVSDTCNLESDAGCKMAVFSRNENNLPDSDWNVKEKWR